MESSEVSASRMCSLCLKNPGKYTCPRCNIPYCSAECYKGEKHMACSEAFYRDCFMQGLKDMDMNKASKEKMTEILKRAQEAQGPESDTESEGEDLHDRFAGLDLDSVDIWSKLTPKEKRDFEAMTQDGRLGNLIEPWQPWWLSDLLVEELNSEATSESATDSKLYKPEVPSNISDIATVLRNKAPSENILFNVLNILYGYGYIARKYNGDHLDNALDSSKCILSISKALGQHAFSNAQDALNDCILNTHRADSSVFVSLPFSVAIIEDIVKLISKEDYVLSALSDLWRLVRKARKELKGVVTKSSKMTTRISKETMSINTHTAATDQHDPIKEQYQTLFHVEKKLDFLLSWSVTYASSLVTLVPAVQLEYCARSSELSRHEGIRVEFEKRWGGPVPPRPKTNKLIEEL